MSKFVVAVVGATGVVGKELIETLESRQFPVKTLRPLASARSAGSTVSFHGADIAVQELTEASFDGVDYALFSAGGSISERFAPFAVKAGAIVIDNTSHFRMDKDVPLVVPEVNAHAIKTHKGIIANPNCSTAQLVLALKPLYDTYGIERIVISTYQSVSGSGKEAMEELEAHSKASLSGRHYEPKVYAHPIAFNVIPQIDVFEPNGYTKEEMKMINETKKILEDESLHITATTVRVPVFIGHSESVNVQLKRRPESITEVRELLNTFPGLSVMDNPEKSEYPTPRELAGQDDTYVGRIRYDVSHENGIEMWVVADNLRKGAALNAVQIAEALIA
jgi:aspartate-semialdehyde dehydrogenase